MNVVDPACITQEQILRGAFVAHLPEEHTRAIGTPMGAVHLERPTPSAGYGKGGGRARYDIAFGDVERPAAIDGLLELKWAGSIDEELPPGLAEDLKKLLDPHTELRPMAFRISWLAAQRHTSGSAMEIVRARVVPIFDELENDPARRLSGRTELPVDPSRGWLGWKWESGVTVWLAWYHAALAEPTRFEPIFG